MDFHLALCAIAAVTLFFLLLKKRIIHFPHSRLCICIYVFFSFGVCVLFDIHFQFLEVRFSHLTGKYRDKQKVKSYCDTTEWRSHEQCTAETNNKQKIWKWAKKLAASPHLFRQSIIYICWLEFSFLIRKMSLYLLFAVLLAYTPNKIQVALNYFYFCICSSWRYKNCIAEEKSATLYGVH